MACFNGGAVYLCSGKSVLLVRNLSRAKMLCLVVGRHDDIYALSLCGLLSNNYVLSVCLLLRLLAAI